MLILVSVVAAVGMIAACGKDIESPNTASPDTANQDQAGQATAHLQAGMELREGERHEDAIAEFGEVIRLDPNESAGYYGRAGSYIALEQPQPAIKDLDEAIPRWPITTG